MTQRACSSSENALAFGYVTTLVAIPDKVAMRQGVAGTFEYHRLTRAPRVAVAA